MLPLRQGVLFPGTSLAVGLGRPKSHALLKSLERGQRVVVSFQRDPQTEDPAQADLLPIGVFAEVKKAVATGDGTTQVVIHAFERCEIASLQQSHPYWMARVTPVVESHGDSPEAQALASLLTDKVREIQPLMGEELQKRLTRAQGSGEPGLIADVVAAALGLAAEKEVSVLVALDIEERLRIVLKYLGEAEAIADLKTKLSNEVQKQFGKHQREAILREQLRAIRRELGEGDEEDGEEDEDSLKKRLDKAELPEAVQKVVDRELKRLGGLGGGQAESHVVRNYLELIADLPWSKRAALKGDIEEVARKLDADHHGLHDVKERILEHLAVEHRVQNHRGAILTLVGPPGVGKTSLGQSIAEATGRKFVRIALGGVRDEAEIRGHRRTYVGALPGRVINALREVKEKNPLILLDEIDKLGQGWMGSPEAALLELLDPEQNKHFTDHYLELPFDLSEVLFLCTANSLQTLSAPLLDRLEIVELKGYTPQEKLAIARRHLLPARLEEHGLEPGALDLPDATIHAIIDTYTREAGVRQLARELTRICRSVVLSLARDAEHKVGSVTVSPDGLADILGKPRFVEDRTERTSIPGVATGLAWTPVGGDVLFVESSRMPGKGRIEITGQLGDVMKESARTALTYLRSHAQELGIEPNLLDNQDVHIHVPAGATPKDGPSAGITILTSLASLFTNKPVRSDTAMTGECTLRGRVLPVGGIASKVLAAHRHGIQRVILAHQNQRDVDDIPEEVRSQLNLVFVDDVKDVLREALSDGTPLSSPEPMSGTSMHAAA